MQPRSSFARAAEALLLVGAILRTLMAVVVVFLSILLIGALAAVSARDPFMPPAPPVLLGVGYLFLGLLLAASAIVAWVAWRRAKAGEAHGPGVLGIVASMLPPVDVILLLGGIFFLVSDEALQEKAPQRAPSAGAAQPPSRFDEMVIRQD